MCVPDRRSLTDRQDAEPWCCVYVIQPLPSRWGSRCLGEGALPKDDMLPQDAASGPQQGSLWGTDPFGPCVPGGWQAKCLSFLLPVSVSGCGHYPGSQV